MNFNTILEEIDILKIILEYHDYSNSFELTTKGKQAKKAEIQNKVKEINLKLSEFNDNLDYILKDVNQDFNFELFIESLKSKSTFDEVNPRIEQEKELEILKANEEYERAEYVKKLNSSNAGFLRGMYYRGPEDIKKLKSLIEKGLDVSDSIYPISRLIEKGRTVGFIKFLIQNGLKLNRSDIVSLKKKSFFTNQDFLEAVYSAKQIDNSIINEILQENE